MFAFSQIQPETTGFVADMAVPMSKYLGAEFEQGMHDSVFSNLYRWGQMQAEKSDTDHPMLTPERANEIYPAEQPYTSPIRENVASLIHDQHIAQMERNFYLSNDNHSMVAGAMGMGTSMLSSMLNPLDLSLMFFPVVGNAPLLGPLEREAIGSLTMGGRVREALNAGLVTREALEAATKYPKFAESVIQGTAFMAVAEIPKQIVAAQYQEDAGNPIVNIASGAGFAAGMHGVFSVLGKLLSRIPAAAQQSMFEKAMDDFIKGKDTDVADLMKTTEVFAREQVEFQQMLDDIEGNKTNAETPNASDLPLEPLTQESLQKKITGIYNDAIQQLRGELLKPGKPPVVPATGPEAEQQFTSVLDEIRQRNLRTKSQIQEAFPKAKLSREEAGVLRRQAWGEQDVKVQQELNVEALLKKAQESVTNEMGAKRKARLQAERDMPNPIPKAEENAQAHDLVVPEDKTIAKVEEQAKDVEQILTPKEEKTKPSGVTPESIGLVKQKGALGKQSYYTTTDPRFTGLSVIINEDGIHLNSIEVTDKGKGTGTEMLNKLKDLADEQGKPLTLTAEALESLDKPDTLKMSVALKSPDGKVHAPHQGTIHATILPEIEKLGYKEKDLVRGWEVTNPKGQKVFYTNEQVQSFDTKQVFLEKASKDLSPQSRLESLYERLGFKRIKGNEFIYEPKKESNPLLAQDELDYMPTQQVMAETLKRISKKELLDLAKKHDEFIEGNVVQEGVALEFAAREFLAERLKSEMKPKKESASPGVKKTGISGNLYPLKQVSEDFSYTGKDKPKVRFDGTQEMIPGQPKDVYTHMDPKNPFTLYMEPGTPTPKVLEALQKKIEADKPMPNAIKSAADCLGKSVI